MKKLLAITLTLAIILSLMSVSTLTASADTLTEGDYEYELIDDGGEVKITKYIGEGGDVTIPPTIAGKPVTNIGDYVFLACSALTSITLPNSVTEIGYEAFYWCTALTSVTIPNSVTSIGDYAFSGCTSLTSVTTPDSVTSIGDVAFGDCYSLTNIAIPDSVTSVGFWAFVDTAWYDNQPDGLVYVGKAAYEYKGECPEQYVIMEGTVSISEQAFADCALLTSITIPNSVTNIRELAFSGCEALTSITVKDGNPVYHSTNNCLIETESKALIAGCKASVIPTDGSVTSVGNYAFCGCTSLTSITIPDSVTTIELHAFYDCKNLETVYYNGTPDDRSKMEIDNEYNGNDALLNATWVYGNAGGNGDATGDGSVDMKDVLQVRKFIAGLSGVTVDKSAADVDGDGELTMKDVLMIRKFIAGLIDKLGK